MEPRQSAGNQSQNLRRQSRDRTGRSNSVPERIGDDAIESGLIDEAAIDHRLRDRLFPFSFRFLQTSSSLRWLQDVLLNKEIGDVAALFMPAANSRPPV